MLRHGHKRNGRPSPTYCSWSEMKKRCLRPTNKEFPRYGGRGITICERWLRFDEFLADMGEKPEGMTLERINNNGNYEPGNCKWASRQEQSSNRRVTRFLDFNGERLCIADWARKINIKRNTLLWRIRAGWSVSQVLTTKIDPPARGEEG